MESLKEFIEANRASKKKIGADIVERWQERIVRHGWQNLGEAGALQYLGTYGKGIAAPKCVMLARQAEAEGCNDIARGFWKKAYELSGGILWSLSMLRRPDHVTQLLRRRNPAGR